MFLQKLRLLLIAVILPIIMYSNTNIEEKNSIYEKCDKQFNLCIDLCDKTDKTEEECYQLCDIKLSRCEDTEKSK